MPAWVRKQRRLVAVKPRGDRRKLLFQRYLRPDYSQSVARSQMIEPVAQRRDWLRFVVAGDQRRSGGAHFLTNVGDGHAMIPSRRKHSPRCRNPIAPFGDFL